MPALALAFSFVLTACGNPADGGGGNAKPATGVVITEGAAITVALDGALTLHAVVSPADSTDALVWSSANTGVAAVNPASGVVTTVATGTVVITAKAGDKTDTITVTVETPKPGITIDEGDAATVVTGKTITLHVTLPEGSTDTVIWSSNEPDIATVDPASGVVTGVAGGKAVITATAGDEFLAPHDEITIYVKDPEGNEYTGKIAYPDAE
jgi:uncharacterized protein YjdB